MKDKLFDLFNVSRTVITETMTIEARKQGDIIAFSPIIHIDSPRDSDDLYTEIVEIYYDKNEDCCYVHNFVTDTNLDVEEYYTPLRDMSFDELFRIAERL